MCILCVIQKWSRKVATMLPWLVIPLIGLWLLSQFLPPAFRFEITSPRLACVLVLLVTLFWYEILMPQLSSWRARRNARLRERKRFEAIEMQKLRKTATRRCRNCLTPYRDQNPSGGRFMCSYCGHISKRPVLDLSVPPGLGRLSNSGILKDLVGKGGKMLNGKVWSDNNWICGQDWLENGGNWVNGSLSGKSSYWKKNSGAFFSGGTDHFFSEKSYSFLLVFICKSLAAIFFGIMWLWGKLFRVVLAEDDTSADDIRGLGKKGENGVNCNESRSEKARRKAEEKRHARLEREQLEEEERKQREEVARLVEERRKLRDEKVVTEKDQGKASPQDIDEKREAQRKRQERKKEKDRGSSKSNSDVDEIEKRAGKETEKNRKGETDRHEHHRSGTESLRSNKTDTGHGSKVVAANNLYKGSVGAKYLDRMRGNFFPSSRTLSAGGFFGKGTNANASNIRENKSSASLDHVQVTANKRDLFQPERAYGKSNAYADDQNHSRPAIFESQPFPAPKRSWQQLFTRSSTTTLPTSTNVISRPNGKLQTEAQSSIASSYPATEGLDSPITSGLPYPPPKFSYGNCTSSTGLRLPSNPMLPRVGEVPTELLPEESDNFEDPCYVPDPASLIGPVSESLENFQLDLGFVPDLGFEKPCPIKHMPGLSEVNRPSPIEAPMSRLWFSDEMRANSFLFPSTQKIQDKTIFPLEDHDTANEKGWQMWNSSPLCQDTLGLVGGPSTWYLPPELSGLNNEGVVQLQPQKTMASMLRKEDHVPSNTNSQQELRQNVGTSNAFMHATSDDPWALRTSYGSMSSNNHLSLNLQEGTTHNEMVYGVPNGSAANHQFQLSHGSVWAKKEKGGPVSVEGIGTTSTMITPVGHFYFGSNSNQYKCMHAQVLPSDLFYSGFMETVTIPFGILE
ncbi:uncharacterized protein LOC112507466 isoform X2 [Cynara cardunculus var. scolymus]|uniref:uncharacterized protein LOC112507466 isoform X2 n=1 Tax=Cynara cardunculus var. scolymus TaxID=59895 RepID=UPI000D62AF49|nr:uncharacterized protein LOC112507466 isoform X2 [Cynara cardunculus var. scolymus]